MEELGYVAGIDDKPFEDGMKRMEKAVESTSKRVEQSGMTVDEFAKRMLGVVASFEKLTQAVDRNTTAQEKVAEAGKKAADAEKQGADKATDAINKTGDATDNLGRKLKNTGEEGSASFDKLSKYAAGFFTLTAAKEFGQKIFDVRSEIQSLQTSFETLVGNKPQAEELFSSIREFAVKTPMQMKDLASAAQTMMSFNIPVEQIMENLKALGDVSMGDAQKFQSLSLAFSQMSATGKLMGQDLLQMINAGFNPLATMSEKTGKSISQLKDEMSKGAISADMVRQAFIDATSEGGKFNGMLEAQSKTLRGAYSKLQGAIDDMFNSIGEQSEGIMAGAINAATTLVQNYEKVGKVILGLVSTYGAYRTAVMAVTVAEQVEIATKEGATVATILYDKAQKLLNATMLANPYVLAATAIGALVSALVLGIKNTDTLAESQQKLNETYAETESAAANEQRKIDELFGSLRKAKKGTDEWQSAKSSILSQYGGYLKGLSNEVSKLNDVEGAYRAVSAAARDAAMARGMEAAVGNINKEYGDTYSKTFDKIRNSIKSRYGEDAASQQMNLLRIHMQRNGGLISDKNKGILKNMMRGSFDFGNMDAWVTGLNNAEKNRQQLLKEAEEKFGKLNKQIFDAIESPNNSSLNSTNGKKGGKTDRTAELDAQSRKKLFEIEQREIERHAKERATLTAAMADLEIASEADASKREQLQREKDHQASLAAIDRQAEEWKKANYEAEKEKWEATNKDKTKTFADTEAGKAGWQGQQLNGTQLAIIKAQTEKENLEYARLVQQRYDNERQAALDFLKEYGDYEQQKLAITEEYEKRIAEAATPSEAASLTMKRNEELEKLGSEKLLDSIDWQGVFNDLSGHTEEYLEGLRDQLQDLLKTGDLPVDQMATIQEKITEINEAINEQGGMFKYASEQQQEHNRRLKEAEDAQKLLNAAREEEARASMEVFTITQQIRDYLTQIGVDSDVDLDDGLIESLGANSEEAKKLADMLKKLRVAQGNYTKAGEESRKKLFNWRKAEDSLNEGWEDAVARVAGNISGWMETYLSDLPDLLSSIGLGGVGEKVSKGMSGISNVAGAAADYASGNYVGAALKAVSAIKDFGSALGIGAGNEAEVARTTEELTKQNELLGNKIEALTEQLSKAYGANAIRVYNDALEAQEKQNKNVMDILKAQMGYHSAHHSNEYYMSDREIRGYNESAQKAFQSAGVTASTINGLTSIYNLTPEQLKAIRDFAPDLWRYLTETGKYDKSEYWDNVVEQAGKTAELTKQIRETLTTTTEENVFSDFLNSLYDLADGSEEVFDNIAEDWRKMVNQMVINNLVGAKFQEDLKGWYEELARINQQMVDGNMSEEWYRDQMANMKNLYDGYVESAQQEINRLRDAGIIQSIAKEEEEALEDVEEEVNKHLDTIRSSFQRLISDTTIDIDKWSKDMRNSILQNLMESKLLDEAFDQWAAQWSDRYASLLDEMTEGAIDQQMFDKQMQGLMYEFDQRTDEVADKARQMWEAFHLGIDEASDTTFKDMGGEFQNALMNLDGTAEDWGKNVGQKMAQRIIEQMVNARMLQPFLDDLQNAFDQAMSVEGVTIDSVLADLAPQIEAAKDAFEEAQPVAQRILSAFGITKKPTMPFSDLRSTFVSTLMDMEADAVSFSKSINRTLTEQMVSRLVEKKYQSQIDALNESWRQALEEGSPARIAEVRKSITDLYEEMGRDEEIKKLRDDLVELKNDGDDTFSSLSDSWTSALMNLDSTAEDWGTEIGQTLAQKIISEMIVGKKLQPYLDDIQQAFDNAFGAEGATPESVIESVKPFIKGAQEAYDNMKPYVNSILDMLEVSSYPDQQAHVNMADKATYDQFELYLGMQTAMMIGQEQGNAVRQQILSTLQTMAGITSPQNDYGSQIFMRLGTTNEYLLDIKKSNKDIFESFGMKLDSINQKLSRL